MPEKDFRTELKRIFTDYRKMNSRMESALKRIGISVGRKQNHVILFVSSESGTRTVSISSTGSDKREGLNIVSKITKVRYGY